MLKRISLLFIPLFFLHFSCNTESNIIGTWSIESLEVGDEKLSGEDLENPSYTFNSDNTYSIKLAGIDQTGTWEIKENIIYLNNDISPESKIRMHILELNKEIFHYSIEEGILLTDVVLKKVK